MIRIYSKVPQVCPGLGGALRGGIGNFFNFRVVLCASVANGGFREVPPAGSADGPRPASRAGRAGDQKSCVVVWPATMVTGAVPVKATVALSSSAGSSLPASQVKAAV